MPDDSFVLKYFKFLKDDLSVGPPFYIVVNSTNLKFDYSNETIRNRICGSYGCNNDSLQNIISMWSKIPATTRIGKKNFLDQYLSSKTLSAIAKTYKKN